MATIFVVDDDEDIRELLKYNLEKSGHAVITCENGVVCLEKIKNHKPDLILLDVMMPEIDGFETCRRIKANPRLAGIPIVFVTALTDHKEFLTLLGKL